MRRSYTILTIAGIALATLVVDQWSKHFILQQGLQMGERLPVIDGFFDVTLTFNTGAVAGLLVGNNRLLTVLSILAIVLLIVFRHSFVTSHREHLIALGLIGGGILGNLVDRVVRGCVVDFLYLHWRGFSLTYVFNIADAAICVGVVCYILALLVPRKSAAPPHQPAASTTAQT